MRLGLRLGLILALVGVVPLAGLALAASGAARSWLVSAAVEFQVDDAGMLASVIARQLADTERVLQLQLGNYQLATASPQVQQAFLISTYRLFPELDVAFLLDAAGNDLVPPVYQSVNDEVQVTGHALMAPERIAEVREAIFRRPTEASVWGSPRPQAGSSPAALTAVFVSPWGDGTRLGVEVSLSGVSSRLRAMARQDREVVLFSLDGVELVQAGPVDLVDAESFRPLLGTVSADLRYRPASGQEVLGALARVPGQNLAVALATPVRSLDAAAEEIRTRTSYIAGVTLLAAMVFGRMLSRSVTDAVRSLRDASARMGSGDLASRVDLQRTDELGELATAFNKMAGSLQQNQEDLGRKNAEIAAFNVELQARVERRTAQLRAAQASLVQSRQLAAVAELSAGLTHELNNPLAGVVGLLQVLKARAGSDALLDAAEREALRCTEIVARLGRFTQGPAQPGDGAEREDVDVHLLLGDLLALLAGGMRERQITVHHRIGSLHVRGEQSALGRALGQLVAAVRTLAAEGATLDIRSEGRQLIVSVQPVLASQDDWRAASLGFWAARKVFEEHGAIVEEPQERSGLVRWIVRFPGSQS